MLVLSAPVFAYLELTFRCNNRCPGCGNVFSRTESQPSLSAGQWREILAKLKAAQVFRVRLTGGEPTLHPEFREIVECTQELDIPFALFTNARWQDPAGLVSFLKGVPQLQGILVSLHGATPQAHEAFTNVPGSFAETVANIQRAATEGLPVNTSTIITRHNWDQVKNIIQLSQRLGAANAVFNRYLSSGADELEPTEEQLISAMDAVDAQRQAGVRARFSVCIPQCFHPSSSTGCLAGIAYFTVDPWGNVRPCNHAPLIVGNLLEQSVEEVWNSEGMQQWRAMIPEQCRGCVALPKCHGGCRAEAMLRGLSHDPLMKEPILDKPPDSPQELTLCAGARPVANFAMRPEPFGYVLVQGNCIMPVSSRAKAVLDALNGQMTLAQIKSSFGQDGLSFVGVLCQRGLVRLILDRGE